VLQVSRDFESQTLFRIWNQRSLPGYELFFGHQKNSRSGFLSDSKFVVTIPSLGVLQAFLHAKFQDRSITLLPKFGAANTEELLESINQEGRIFRLHPGFET